MSANTSASVSAGNLKICTCICCPWLLLQLHKYPGTSWLGSSRPHVWHLSQVGAVSREIEPWVLACCRKCNVQVLGHWVLQDCRSPIKQIGNKATNDAVAVRNPVSGAWLALQFASLVRPVFHIVIMCICPKVQQLVAQLLILHHDYMCCVCHCSC